MTPTISMKQIFSELKKIEKQMVTKGDMEAVMETIDILGNPDTMRQIAASMDDIQHGRVREVRSVQDLLDEM